MAPGYKTTEFWLSLAAMIVGTLLAAGVFGEGDTAYKILAFVGATLASFGYSYSRGRVKSAETFASLPSPKTEATPDPR